MDPSLSRAELDAQFKEKHLAHIAQHSRMMVRRSRTQIFDMQFKSRHRPGTSDTILASAAETKYGYTFKTTDAIAHERMAERPFVSYDAFDVAAFSDYGLPKYDKKIDGGTPEPKRVLTREERVAARQAKRAARGIQ